MSEYCANLDEIIAIESNVGSLGIAIAYTVSWTVERRSFDVYPYSEDVENLMSYVRSRYTLEELRNDPIVRAYRDFFWRIGIDPTKVRPSSEALVRRALRGSFPRIDDVVDAGNIASAYTMVPIGIYDLGKAQPPFKITLSSGGEVFKPIGGSEERLDKGIPILIDSRGVVMHIYPHRDSVETCVDRFTRSVLIVGAGVPKVPIELVREAVERVVKLLEKIGWSWCRRVVVKSSTT